jgi:predicted nucleotidyltransferase
MSTFSSYVAAHRAERERAERDRPALAEQAKHAATEAARRIVERVGAQRVILFGSLARGSFGARSDIDLAVVGMPLGKLVDAIAAVEDGCVFRVDVLPLEQTRPEIRAAILDTGVTLWRA